jgi:hypothetical protein
VGPQPGCALCCGQGRTPLVIDRGSYGSAREYLLAWHDPIKGLGLCCPVCDTGKHEPLVEGLESEAVIQAMSAAGFAMHQLAQIVRGWHAPIPKPLRFGPRRPRPPA